MEENIISENITHSELCRLTAERFVKSFALWEVKGKWENPDVITWNSSGRSTIFEIKMSRADFLADAKKKCRLEGHKRAGDYFAYVCNGEFIKKDEIPENWGLFYYKNGKFRCVKKIPSMCDWDSPLKDWQNEMIMLVNFLITNRYFYNERFVFNERFKDYKPFNIQRNK